MRRTGFTLLEATVALAIVGIVAIGALEAFAVEARTARRARDAAPAVAVAGERLARLELLDGTTLRALPDSLARGTVAAGPRTYRWEAGARRVANEPGLFELRVDVRWESGAYALASRSYRPAGPEAP